MNEVVDSQKPKKPTAAIRAEAALNLPGTAAISPKAQILIEAEDVIAQIPIKKAVAALNKVAPAPIDKLVSTTKPKA